MKEKFNALDEHVFYLITNQIFLEYLKQLDVRPLQHFSALDEIKIHYVLTEEVSFYKDVVLNGRSTFNNISAIVGNSVQVPIQNSVKGFF